MLLEDDIMRDTFPCMFKLVLLSRLIPTSTASVERIFSLMNCICTENGNRLGQDTLCALMRICRHGSQSLTPLQVSGITDTFKDMKAREINL